MILEAQTWHGSIFDVLRAHTFTFSPDPAMLNLQEGRFPCPDCPRVFTTPQGVHTHRRKVHGVFCPEHHLLDPATCPACMTFFWSAQRLQQHLSYMPRAGGPNRCFAYLQRLGYKVSYSAVALPTNVRGQSRLDALTVAGPHWEGPTSLEREVHRLRHERQRLMDEIADFDVPSDVVGAGDRLASVLTAVTWRWFGDFCRAHHQCVDLVPLRDRWIDVLCNLPDAYESWASRTFLAWGEHLMPDIQAALIDGEAEHLLDAAFADLAIATCMNTGWMRGCDKLNYVWIDFEAMINKFLFLTGLSERWHEDLRRVRWDAMPADPTVPMVSDLAPRPSFIIVHLFAGRRQHTDLHSYLDTRAAQRNYALTILFFDTANILPHGNPYRSSISRAELLRRLVATLARLSPQPDGTSHHLNWRM
eukprot:s462_g65.t1